jgi:hypothetical protein
LHTKGQFRGRRPVEEPRKSWENGVWFDAAILKQNSAVPGASHYEERRFEVNSSGSQGLASAIKP